MIRNQRQFPPDTSQAHCENAGTRKGGRERIIKEHGQRLKKRPTRRLLSNSDLNDTETAHDSGDHNAGPRRKICVHRTDLSDTDLTPPALDQVVPTHEGTPGNQWISGRTPLSGPHSPALSSSSDHSEPRPIMMKNSLNGLKQLSQAKLDIAEKSSKTEKGSTINGLYRR